MTKTIVGLFENARDAQATRSDLKDLGLDQDTTTLVEQHEPELRSRLVAAGIPQRDAQLLADGVGRGQQLIVAQGIADDDAQQVAAMMDRHNVIDINRTQPTQQRTARTTTSTTASASALNTNLYDGQDLVVPIIEEELRIGKRAVEGGGVRVRTRMEEVPVSEQVTLRDETVSVERHAVDRAVTDADLAAMHDETFELHETDEEAVVSKEARIVEEVVINKRVQDRTETVQDTVRRTQVDVNELPGQTTTRAVTTSGMTASTAPAPATLDVSTSSTATDEGAIEGGAAKAGNAVERAVGADMDRDGDVGQRDPRNNR